MDTFMDKLAQKFTAQEMIKANSAAEAAELQRVRDQVKKYNDCLQEMKQVNDDTQATLAQINETLAAGMEQFKNAEIPLEGMSNDIMDFVHKENVKVYRNVQAVVVEELKKQNEELGAKLDAMSKTQRTTRNVAVSAMFFALLAAAALAAQLLIQFGIVSI